MIKAVVLDIDGVIVGTKKGINFPHPGKRVCEALRKVHHSGIPVVFITAKASFAASENIKLVGIDNPHIADAGAVLFNPIQGTILHVKSISSKDIRHILSATPNDKLVILFTIKDYFILKKVKEKFPDFVLKYGEFMERLPILIERFDGIIKNEEITKINIAAFDEKEKNQITKMISKSPGHFSYRWGTTPYFTPIQVMIITASGVSKKSGVETLVKDLKLSLDEVLGVGDMMLDWDFLEVCGYKATLANASIELKNKFDFSDKRQFIGRHVDEDGLIDILKHFSILR